MKTFDVKRFWKFVGGFLILLSVGVLGIVAAGIYIAPVSGADTGTDTVRQ